MDELSPKTKKRVLQLRLPQQVIDFFRAGGPGHLSRMQEVLSRYVRDHLPSAHRPSLAMAVHTDNFSLACELLASGADANVLDRGGMPLAWAVRYNQLSMALLLLSAGAAPDCASVRSNGYTVLMEASAEGRHQLVHALLAAGANPNLQSQPSLKTALMMAANHGYQLIVQILLAGGADPTLRDSEGNTALTIARRDVEMSHLLFPEKQACYIEIVRLLTAAEN